jgi:hypothetical protein
VTCFPDSVASRLPVEAALRSWKGLPLPEVIRGDIEAFYVDCCQVWDHAPWVLLMEEAGGRFTDHEGRSLTGERRWAVFERSGTRSADGEDRLESASAGVVEVTSSCSLKGEVKVAKNGLHFDLRPDDQAAEARRLEQLGSWSLTTAIQGQGARKTGSRCLAKQPVDHGATAFASTRWSRDQLSMMSGLRTASPSKRWCRKVRGGKHEAASGVVSS